jgi:hypothetical protein
MKYDYCFITSSLSCNWTMWQESTTRPNPMGGKSDTQQVHQRHFTYQRVHDRNSFYFMISLLPLLTLLFLALGCTDKKRNANDSPEGPKSPSENQAVSPRASVEGLLDVNVKLRDTELLLGIKNAPKGSVFECEMSHQPVSPCYDGAILKRPLQDGSYSITVDAMVDGKRVATGTSPVFTVAKGSIGTTSEDTSNPLSLKFTDPHVQFAMTAPRSKDFTVNFSLVRPNACDKPEFRCRLDGAGSFFWTACDEKSNSFTVKSSIIATGPQDLSIQARCGDVVGPILNLRWYGVPDNYQDLMLQDLNDGNGRHLLELVRDIDCPKDKRRFECSVGQESFSLCPNANQFTSPPKDLRVRLSCDGRVGPEQRFND